MRSTRTIVFGCALIAAALVFWGVLRAISQSNTSQTGNAATTVAQNGTPGPAINVAANTGAGIAYAVTDIPAGAIITREMLALKPSQGKPAEGFVTDLDSQAIGFITRRPIPAKSEIRPDEDFIGHISQVGIAGALAPGTRALVLPVPGKATLHDLVKIGNSVDVLASFDGQEARVIAQNMRVLAVDVFANDFPQVNAAMRGPYKADPLGRGVAASPAAPGASNAGANAAPDSVEPTESPTPIPQNAPAPEPSLTLEVTPQQAAAIQLALASQAPIDFLVRPALPAGRSSQVTLVSDTSASDGTTNANADGLNGTLAASVTKRQIAPYAEAIKNAGKNGGRTSNASNTGTRTASTNARPGRGGGRGGGGSMMPDFPPPTVTTSTSGDGVAPMPIAPAFPPDGGGSSGNSGNGSSGGSMRPLAPQPPASYQIPIYADGGIVRTETVPLPTPRP